MKFLPLLLLCALETVAQDVHIHRLHYAINGRDATPNMCQVSIIRESDTLARISGKHRLLLPETDGNFSLFVEIDDVRLELGPFPSDLLKRGSKMSILKVTDLSFLMTTANYFYTRARRELESSGRIPEFEKAVIFTIESDALKTGGTTFKQSTTGRIKLWYKK